MTDRVSPERGWQERQRATALELLSIASADPALARRTADAADLLANDEPNEALLVLIHAINGSNLAVRTALRQQVADLVGDVAELPPDWLAG